ncbi:beta/gamma crystallin domain-containing protein [Catellatospora coxensis]|nr:hypothetical protein [Catellatospora coxensis]
MTGVALAAAAVAATVVPAPAHATYVVHCETKASQIHATAGSWCFAGTGSIPVNIPQTSLVLAGDRNLLVEFSDGSSVKVNAWAIRSVCVQIFNSCVPRNTVRITRS